MEKLKIRKFEKTDWLLTNKQALLIHGGRTASTKLTGCTQVGGNWCCDDEDAD